MSVEIQCSPVTEETDILSGWNYFKVEFKNKIFSLDLPYFCCQPTDLERTNVCLLTCAWSYTSCWLFVLATCAVKNLLSCIKLLGLVNSVLSDWCVDYRAYWYPILGSIGGIYNTGVSTWTTCWHAFCGAWNILIQYYNGSESILLAKCVDTYKVFDSVVLSLIQSADNKMTGWFSHTAAVEQSWKKWQIQLLQTDKS